MIIYVVLFIAAFDIRLPPTVDQAEFESTIQHWCTDAGPGVTYQFVIVSRWSSFVELDKHTYTVGSCLADILV